MSVWTLNRQDNGASVTLPQDMRWTDEFAWSAVAQTQPVYSLSGALLVQQAVKQGGRPITLEGDWVWHPRVQAATLRAWSDVPGLKMTLHHPDGRRFDVIYRLHEGALSRVEPVRYATPEADQDKYTLTLCLMTV